MGKENDIQGSSRESEEEKAQVETSQASRSELLDRERTSLNEHERAYLAGLISGRGKLYLFDRSKFKEPRRVVLLFKALRKGDLHFLKEKFPKGDYSIPRNCALVGAYAAQALVEGYGHMRSLKKKTQIVLRYTSTFPARGFRVCEEDLAIRKALEKQWDELKGGDE